ncbi:DUF599 domain-containing protein [Aestuariicella hydrocarbonica]|uniref:DUF599 domain-containing protein n=2 Tax=Pseudomaricurvus hydrocarbonicus TaxID=1470433 RepID=A0A9E5MJR1_9GAMM|nr:DUF599 domain-containing protein [Aestuariicella hydrocarbonica]
MEHMTDWVNLGCLVWFLGCWVGYSRFARHMAKRTDCLASVMHSFRLAWMREVLFREIRMPDASIIANLERSVSFMASTTILVLAGIVTVLASSDQVYGLLQHLPFVAATTSAQLQFKLLVLVFIFVYAFFTFTWSLRQFSFCNVILGATPIFKPGDIDQAQRDTYARHTGKVLDQASHSYNFGLRAYYFSMAMLAWFIHPLAFVLAVALVVAILYRREFHSRTLHAMVEVSQDWGKPTAPDDHAS